MADPDWIAHAAAHLDRLQPPHREKKRATILALVDARIAGRSEETVWARPEACSRTAYHGKGHDRAGWKHDPVFADVLATVTNMARRWNDTRTIRALATAAERLALASPVAVARIIQRLDSDDEQVVMRAAIAILDRAGIETATKSAQTVDQTVTLNADQFAALRREAEDLAASIEEEADEWLSTSSPE